MASNGQDIISITRIPDFWSRLKGSKRRFMALDYDGTLAPFRAERMEAYPLPGIPDLINSIAECMGTSLAIISGRPIAELLTLLDARGIILVGSHGFEQMRPDGELIITSPNPGQLIALDQAEEAAHILGFGPELEKKVASLALHTRKMAPESAAYAENLISGEWSRLTTSELECRKFDGGVEIRAKGRNKGDVLQELLGEQPSGTFSVYIGDDETDEDAFRTLRGQGIGIKVGDPEFPTAAEGFLPNCEAVRDFLRQWLSIISTEGVLT